MLFKHYLTLAKPILSVAIAFTSFAGYVIAKREVNVETFYVFTGVLLMSSGVSALNQVIERKTDALMERTKKRPLASGTLSVKNGITAGLVIFLIGFILILSLSNWAALLGIFNAVWYLGVYTPLKQKSVFALLVGTITGAIPFIMGFLTAGTSQSLGLALFVSLFLVIWQIPHFLLLIVKYGAEYETAGLATLSTYWGTQTVKRVTILWIIASAMSILLLPFFSITQHWIASYGLVLLSIFSVVFVLIKWNLWEGNKTTKQLMLLVNLVQFTLMLLLIADTLFR